MWRRQHFNSRLILFSFFITLISLSPFSLWKNIYSSTSDFFQINTLYTALQSSTIYTIITKCSSNEKKTLQFSFPFSENRHKLYDEIEYVKDLVRIHKYEPDKKMPSILNVGIDSGNVDKQEAHMSLVLAVKQQSLGRLSVALKLLKHAAELDPSNAVILTALGEAFEKVSTSNSRNINGKSNSHDVLVFNASATLPEFDHKQYTENLIAAEEMYARAILNNPDYEKAKENQRRTLPIVEKIDKKRLRSFDHKVTLFYNIPESNIGLRLAKIEHYFQHIYHSNAIEGNTLSLAQTRAILETKIAIGGKSLQEQNEVLGLDAAFRFLNTSLLRGTSHPILLNDILEMHRRILTFVDLAEAGRFRQTQVFIAEHVPPAPEVVPQLVDELLYWINSDAVADLHPIELAALAHWKLVYIHPFYDGNGRTARLLMNLLLMRAGFPPAIIRKEDRHLYYATLKTANIGDVRPFIRFIADCAEKTIDEYLTSALGSAVGDVEKSVFVTSVTSSITSTMTHNSAPLVQYAPDLCFSSLALCPDHYSDLLNFIEDSTSIQNDPTYVIYSN